MSSCLIRWIRLRSSIDYYSGHIRVEAKIMTGGLVDSRLALLKMLVVSCSSYWCLEGRPLWDADVLDDASQMVCNVGLVGGGGSAVIYTVEKGRYCRYTL